MTQWAIYNSDGAIKRVYSGPESEAALQLQGGEQLAVLIEGLDDATAYVISGQVVPKQPFSLQLTNPQLIADGVDECVIGNIPASTTVEWPDGRVDEVTDGEVRFSVDLAGTYTLRFTAVPYLDQEVTIEAVSAA